MAKDTPYLDVQHLTKSFGSLVLFEDINFSVAEGQHVGLIALDWPFRSAAGAVEQAVGLLKRSWPMA